MDGQAWWAVVCGVAESRTQLSDFTFTFHFHPLEKEMATHSSVLAWRIPGTGEPGGLPSMGSHRVGHEWSDSVAAAAMSTNIVCLGSKCLNKEYTDPNTLNDFFIVPPIAFSFVGSWFYQLMSCQLLCFQNNYCHVWWRIIMLRSFWEASFWPYDSACVMTAPPTL